MYKNKSKAANEHHDVSEKHDRKKTEEHTLTQKSLHPGFLQTQDNILQLQRTIGNKAVMQLLKSATALQPAADGGNQVSDNSAVLQMAIEVDDQSHEEDNGRAHHVTATVYGETLEQGANQPSVDPEGWDELKGDSAYNTENLVRMHLWNGRLGGPGDKKWNLTPGESDFNLHEMSPVETEMQSEVDEGNIVTIDTTVTYGNMEEPLYYYPTHVNLSWASFDGENGDAQNEGELDEDVPALEEEDGEWLPDSSGNESEE